MAKICPSCGTQAADDQARFCNKCGYPFPKTRPDNTTIVSRVDTRVYEAPSNARGRAPLLPRVESRPPRQKKTGRSGTVPFKKFIAGKYIRLIYFLGAIAIILVSLLEISTDISTTGAEAATLVLTNTTALVQNPSASPLFWIGFLIFGSLLWRIFCELVSAVFRIYDAVEEGEDDPPGDDSEDREGWAEGMVQCPRCGKVVASDQLRECEHCGVQGCSNCIRMMGLVRKTLTCKDCFENK
jgi:ribosomal protein L37E